MSALWQHVICDSCWFFQYPDRHPVKTVERIFKTCCFCGAQTAAGIYVRVAPIDPRLKFCPAIAHQADLEKFLTTTDVVTLPLIFRRGREPIAGKICSNCTGGPPLFAGYIHRAAAPDLDYVGFDYHLFDFCEKCGEVARVQ